VSEDKLRLDALALKASGLEGLVMEHVSDEGVNRLLGRYVGEGFGFKLDSVEAYELYISNFERELELVKVPYRSLLPECYIND